MANSTEERLAELTWRTIKLRASLLALTVLGLLVIWSAVLSGDQKARDVDVKFCSQLSADQNAQTQNEFQKSGITGAVSSLPPSSFTCSSHGARSYIEAFRNLNQFYTLDWGDKANKKLLALYRANQGKLAAYDAERRDAYKLQIELSSIGTSSVTVNALLIAEVAPFVAFIVLSVVVLLGFQQERYKSELASHISNSEDGPALAIARAQFLAVPKALASGHFIVSPEKLTIWALAAAVILALAGVLSAFIVNVIHLTDSIFGTYTSSLCNTGIVLAFLLLATRRGYATLNPRRVDRPYRERPTWIEWGLITLALLSFLFPWTLEFGRIPALRGYTFLLKQVPLKILGAASTLPITPRLYHQMRTQLAIALFFVLLCAIHLIARSKNWRWTRAVLISRGLVAALVLALCVNFILYMGILEYEAISGMQWDIVNEFSLVNVVGGKSGLPLSFYDPSYGFILFLASCFVLIWFSLGRYLRTP